jgi:hypothetical protein
MDEDSRPESSASIKASPLSEREDRPSTPWLFWRKRRVCAGLRRLAGQRRSGRTQTFFRHFAIRHRGMSGPIATKRKNQNWQKSKTKNLQNCQIQNRENPISKFFPRNRSRNCFAQRSYSCSQDQRRDFRMFVSSLLRLLVLHSNARGVYLMRANSVPMKRRHSTWLNSHGSEERT